MFVRRLNLLAILLMVSAGLMLPACRRNNSGSISETPSVHPAPKGSPLSAFERDLQFVRNGQYRYVWVFSRKDGKTLDKGDGAYLRSNAPQVVDWVITDEGKRAIGGTNFNLEEGNMGLLKKRFVVEDYTGK